jgi:hypothetical protein
LVLSVQLVTTPASGWLTRCIPIGNIVLWDIILLVRFGALTFGHNYPRTQPFSPNLKADHQSAAVPDYACRLQAFGWRAAALAVPQGLKMALLNVPINLSAAGITRASANASVIKKK